MKKILSLILCLMIVLSMTALAEPKASELLSGAFETLPESFTISMKVVANADVNFEVEGQSQAISAMANIDGTIDYVDQSGHGVISVKANAMGMDFDIPYEFYADANTGMMYSCSDGETWTKSQSSVETIENTVGGIADEDRDGFDAVAKVTAIDDGYLIEVPFTYIIEKAQTVASDDESPVAEMAEDYTDIIDALEKAVENLMVKMTVNNDNVFTGIHLNGFNFNVDTVYEDMPMKVDATLDVDIDIKNIDALSVDKVVVPQEIVDVAVEMEDSFSDDMYDISSEDSDVIHDYGVGENDKNLDLASLPDDALGSLNGLPFVAGKNDYSIFVNDGWKADADYDGQFSFLLLTNDKYDKYMNMSVFAFPNESNTTEAMLIENGIGGYDVSYNTYDSKLPNMTWGGLTWGASPSQIKAVYGEPVYETEGTNHNSYTYYIDYDKNWSIQFWFDSDGLAGVNMDCSR